jgi:hypothetical protein
LKKTPIIKILLENGQRYSSKIKFKFSEGCVIPTGAGRSYTPHKYLLDDPDS